MNSSIAILAAVVVIAVIAVLILKKKATSPASEAKEPERQGDPALFALGMNPISEKPIMYALTTCQHCKGKSGNPRLHVHHLQSARCQAQGQEEMPPIT